MKDTDQIQACAELMGWKNCRRDEWGSMVGRHLPDGIEKELPKFLTDLSAAVQLAQSVCKQLSLDWAKDQEGFDGWTAQIRGQDHKIIAAAYNPDSTTTGACRAIVEAVLRFKGLWTE